MRWNIYDAETPTEMRWNIDEMRWNTYDAGTPTEMRWNIDEIRWNTYDAGTYTEMRWNIDDFSSGTRVTKHSLEISKTLARFRDPIWCFHT